MSEILASAGSQTLQLLTPMKESYSACIQQCKYSVMPKINSSVKYTLLVGMPDNPNITDAGIRLG